MSKIKTTGTSLLWVALKKTTNINDEDITNTVYDLEPVSLTIPLISFIATQNFNLLSQTIN